MIDVKEANEATAQVRKECIEKMLDRGRQNSVYGLAAADTFCNPAEMVTISAIRFERMIRENDDLRVRLTSYENQLNAVSSFVDQEAMKYAQKGRELPSWEDAYKVGELIHWTEPAGVRYVRLDVEQTAKTIQEVKENGEATD